MMRGLPLIFLAAAVLGCARASSAASETVSFGGPEQSAPQVDQVVVVTTPDWNATTGTLRRFERNARTGGWDSVGTRVPVVVGRTGLAWGPDYYALSGQPVKHEGDGKSPAGMFSLDTAFGFARRDSLFALRLPYVQLRDGSDCVDDEKSVHYNTVVDRAAVPRVDWTSAEHMRQISVYRIGVIVGYNDTAPVRGRGSCIFLHIWNGPASTTAGCTAFDAAQLAALMQWLDARKHPVIVQVPASEYARFARQKDLPPQ